MRYAERLLDFMRETEQRFRSCIDWRQFKIVVSPEAYELLVADSHQITPPMFGEVQGGTLFGCKLEMSPNAKEEFAFVADGVKLAPYREPARPDDLMKKNQQRMAKERETIADANLPNLCWLLRAEAYSLRHGNPTSYHEDIVPMHTTGLANFISAIADCIEKYIKVGAAR